MNPKTFFASIIGILSIVMLAGCTTTFSPVKVNQPQIGAGASGNKKAVLVITPELESFKFAMALVGGTDVYPMGGALKDYATAVVSRNFTRFETVTGEDKAASVSGAELILTPKVVKSDNSFGKGNFNATIVIEWSAKNASDKNVVWLKTVTGNASESMGNGFTTFRHRRQLFQKLFEDISPKTQQAFQEAAELK